MERKEWQRQFVFERTMPCNFCKKGIPIPNLMIHEEVCRKKLASRQLEETFRCPNCSEEVSITLIEVHENECPGRMQECTFCHEPYPDVIMDQHEEQCDRRPVVVHRMPSFPLPMHNFSAFMEMLNTRNTRSRRRGISEMNGLDLLLNLLKHINVKKKVKPFEGENYTRVGAEQNCSICMCEVENKELVVRLECRHIYHKDCINKWIEESAICPQCRKEIGGVEAEEEQDDLS